MSVKLMTSDQIQNDLEATNRTWPGGIPPEQTDRVNALKSELKRRGETVRSAAKQQAPQANGRPQSIASMTDDQLAKEMRDLASALGSDPNDDSRQERFADVRFELRKRAKAAPAEETQPTSPSVSARAIEIPDEEEPKKSKSVTASTSTAAPASSVKGFSAQLTAQGVIVKYTAQDANGTIVQIASRFTSDEYDALIVMLMSQTTVNS
jgi:hypothetical protein